MQPEGQALDLTILAPTCPAPVVQNVVQDPGSQALANLSCHPGAETHRVLSVKIQRLLPTVKLRTQPPDHNNSSRATRRTMLQPQTRSGTSITGTIMSTIKTWWVPSTQIPALRTTLPGMLSPPNAKTLRIGCELPVKVALQTILSISL